MRWWSCLAFVAAWLAVLPTAEAGTGRVLKVLPEFLDLKGRTSLSPSLYERDAYQAALRQHPQRRSGIQFFIQWKAKGFLEFPLKIRVELRGSAEGNLPKRMTLEEPLKAKGGWFSQWATVSLSGDAYKKFGGVTAWRVTLLEGDKVLSEEKSFLW